MNNLQRLQANLRENSIPALMVSNMGNVQWLTGFTGSFGAALITPDSGRMLTDSRYTVQAGEQVQDLPSFSFASPTSFVEFLHRHVSELDISTLHIDESQVTVGSYHSWTKVLKGVTLVPDEDPIHKLRMVKTAREVALVQEACQLADACLEFLLPKIKVGVTENELLLEIELFFRRNGSVISFPPIVASGERSARPHGVPSDKPLETGDFVTFDLGCKIQGYCSDITRTFVIGKATERHKEVYAQVLKAETSCIEALKAGVNGRDVDALARRILDEKGLAKYFGHGLGHGLGTLVHDSGRLSSTVDQPIELGQIWTVEPGVYIEGFGGVRIEDDVVITETGNEILTHFPKELLEL